MAAKSWRNALGEGGLGTGAGKRNRRRNQAGKKADKPPSNVVDEGTGERNRNRRGSSKRDCSIGNDSGIGTDTVFDFALRTNSTRTISEKGS